MKAMRSIARFPLGLGVGVVGLLVVWCAGSAAAEPVALTGSQEVPPVTTSASGVADISVIVTKCPAASSSATDCPTMVGTVSVSGVSGTAAHVHLAPAGKNGPVIVPLIRQNDTTWAVAPGTTITRDQYQAWWDGNLYVNVHSAANPGGEIRAQLKR